MNYLAQLTRSTGTEPCKLSGTELMRRTATPVYSRTGRAISMPTFDGEWRISTETINTVYRELIIIHLGWNCNNISIKRSKIKRFWVGQVTNLNFGKFCNEFIWGEIEGRASFTRNTKNNWILDALRERGMARPGTTCRSRDRHLRWYWQWKARFEASFEWSSGGKPNKGNRPDSV